jgi:tetratricopeptide (TPR) repeat protein
MIKEFTQQHDDERRPYRKVILPALVQASKFSKLHWKRRCIDIVEQEGIQNADPYTQAYFCVRKAFVLRSEGDWAASFRIVREHLALLENKDLDPRLNAVRGLLVHSLATSLWERENFDDATSVWTKWKVGQSLFETRVSIKLLTGTGKSMLHQGNYADAETSLKSALRQYIDGSRLRLDVLATLSDVYCELRDPYRALSVLTWNGILQDSSNDRYYTNCYVSYAQALVCMHKTEEAESILLKLKERLESDSHIDRHDRRRYIRVVLLLAQNLHFQAETPPQWKRTVERWTVVIQSTNGFEEVSCWDLGMIFLSMHHAALQSGETNSDWLAKGTSELEKDGRFWMRGMTTYWHDFLVPNLPRVDVQERLLRYRVGSASDAQQPLAHPPTSWPLRR